jgi:hypothetical protein
MVVRACRLLITVGRPVSIISLCVNDLRGISGQFFVLFFIVFR